MSAAKRLARAERSIATAPLVLNAGDPDRACSAAYYAMFYAARAALFHVGQPERALGKTHSGTIASFHQYLAHPGLIDPRQGRALQNEFSRRLIADYDADGLDASEALQSIDSARAFVAAVAELLARPGPVSG